MPDRCDQIVFAYDAFAVADQVFQEIEDLWLDRDKASPASQLRMLMTTAIRSVPLKPDVPELLSRA